MTIQEKVAEKLSSCGETVINTVVDSIVNLKVTERAGIVTKTINKLDSLQKDLSKIDGKPDTTYYGTDGVKTEVISQKRFEEVKKLKETIEKLTKALETALETNTDDSYTKLNGQLGGNKSESTATTE